MKRRSIVRIISFSLSIVVAAAVFSLKTKMENDRYILEIESSYSYMLDELGSATNNISTILNKARFATTPAQVSGMAAQLLTEAELSKNSLAQLPVSEELSSLNRFFSQVGNYAMSVSKSLITEGEISNKDTANIELLSDTADKVAEIVNKSRTSYNNLEYWASQLETELDSAVDSETLDSSLGEIEDELKDYPTLIYDGPYSDHILEKEPVLLQDAAEIEKNDGLKTAAKWAEMYSTDLEFAGKTSGRIPTFDYLGVGVTVSITVKGGHVLYMRKERSTEDIILSYEQALDKAKRYLEKMGMTNLQETYYYESDGICTVNFAYLDGKTLCYTDLIKIGVAMDDGEIVLYEAGGYISNHTDRAFKTPEYTEEQARELISPKLTVQEVGLALIPTDSVEEKRCYEFTCVSADGQDILVYINTATLAEEEILILCKSDGGTLVK